MQHPEVGILPSQNDLLEYTSSKTQKNNIGTPPSSYVCSICGKTLSQKSSLNRHVKVHQGIKPFECSFHCGKTFSTAANCRRHELQHSTTTPYHCNVEGCYRSFKSLSALSYHKKTHSNERYYVCTFQDCKKTFLSQSNLTKHMLTHTSTQKFFCPYCERQYKRRNDMVRHVRKKHEFVHDSAQTNTEQLSNLVEQNKKQAEIIGFLLERNKQLQDKLNQQMLDIKSVSY